jgi:hypothetical protein
MSDPSKLTNAELAATMREELGGWYFSGRCTLAPLLNEVASRLARLDAALPSGDAEPVGWIERDGDNWVVHSRETDPDLVEHIEKYQKASHGVTVFPFYAPAKEPRP